MNRTHIFGMLFSTMIGLTFAKAAPPEWAVAECRGLKALSEVVYHWIDRQNADGSFGFGLDDDCEFYDGWPMLIYAADDQRVMDSLHRAMDWVWYVDEVQDGYAARAGDACHNAQPASYTQPLLTFPDFGNPILIERMMTAAKHIEKWTGINRKGHRLFRSNWFGSREIRDYSYFATDATIGARGTIPMMHLLWYNRDPDLAHYYVEWGRAWVHHAKETKWGKPFGLLPGEIVYETDEAGGLTKTWWNSASSGRSLHLNPWYMIRLHQALVMNYMLTGDPEFLLPLRETLKFFGTATPENTPRGVMWPDWYDQRVPPEEGQKPEETRYAWENYKARISGRGLPELYRWVTGDRQFDRWWGEPPVPTRETALQAGQQATRNATMALEEIQTINIQSSTDNYRARKYLDPLREPHGYPALYHGGSDGLDLPWPSCRWLNGNYELAVVLLDHAADRFKALCCNTGEGERSLGVQLFELLPGTYKLTLGIDTNGDDVVDESVWERQAVLNRGSKVDFELRPAAEYILEIRQIAKGPEWTSRADVAVCGRDIFAVPAAPEPGKAATLKIRVHNIGTEDARQVTIRAEELPGGAFIGEQTIDILARPRDMVPSSVMVEMPWRIGAKAEQVRVVADAADTIEEIYEGNNEARIALKDVPDGPRIKRKIYIPSWYEQEQKGPVAVYQAPYVENITMDGVPDEAAWKKAERRGPLKDLNDEPNEKETYVRIGYGDDALYFAVEAVEPDMDLLTEIAVQRDTYEVFESESFEFFIDSNHDKQTYLQFACSTNGVMAEGQFFNFSIFNEPWECKVHKGKDFWSAEARIPYTSLSAVARPGQTWGINIYRSVRTFRMPESEAERRKGWKSGERHALSPTFDDYHQPGRFAAVAFAPRN